MILKTFWKDRVNRFSIPNLFSFLTPSGQLNDEGGNTQQNSQNIQSVNKPSGRSSSSGKERDELEEKIKNANAGLFLHLQNLINDEQSKN